MAGIAAEPCSLSCCSNWFASFACSGDILPLLKSMCVRRVSKSCATAYDPVDKGIPLCVAVGGLAAAGFVSQRETSRSGGLLLCHRALGRSTARGRVTVTICGGDVGAESEEDVLVPAFPQPPDASAHAMPAITKAVTALLGISFMRMVARFGPTYSQPDSRTAQGCSMRFARHSAGAIHR